MVTGAWGVEVEKTSLIFFMHFWTALMYIHHMNSDYSSLESGRIFGLRTTSRQVIRIRSPTEMGCEESPYLVN